MPRAKANPDPLVIEHERPDIPGVVFTISARRDGGYAVHRAGKFVYSQPSKLNAGYGAPRWPSNRLQDEAVKDARVWINLAMKSALE